MDGVEAPYIRSLHVHTYIVLHVRKSRSAIVAASAAYDCHDNTLNVMHHSDASNFLPRPQKLCRQIPSIFCTGYLRDDPQMLKMS